MDGRSALWFAFHDTFLSAEATEVPKLAASICDTVLAQRARSRVQLLESMEKQFKEDQFRLYQAIPNRTRDWPFMELPSGCQSGSILRRSKEPGPFLHTIHAPLQYVARQCRTQLLILVDHCLRLLHENAK